MEAELKIPYKTYQEGNILACTNSMVVSTNTSFENRRNMIVHCCKLHGLQEWSSSLNHAELIGIVSFYF